MKSTQWQDISITSNLPLALVHRDRPINNEDIEVRLSSSIPVTSQKMKCHIIPCKSKRNLSTRAHSLISNLVLPLCIKLMHEFIVHTKQKIDAASSYLQVE